MWYHPQINLLNHYLAKRQYHLCKLRIKVVLISTPAVLLTVYGDNQIEGSYILFSVFGCLDMIQKNLIEFSEK